MNDERAERHAVYFAPAPGHPLWAAGCSWLGRDARSAPASSRPRAEVAEPWRYGWHATLKAPMSLAPGVDERNWLAAVKGLAARHAPFAMPALRVDMLADFLALRPEQALTADHPLRRLADDCVQQLDAWRAPLSHPQRERQLKPGLSERQREHVQRFGYAHVLDDWRFHMTLTGSLAALDPARRAALRQAAEDHFAAALAVPLCCDALCVFVEPSPGVPFELRHRFLLAAPRSTSPARRG